MKYYTYILKSQKTGRYYVGQTNDLRRRVYEHNSGKNKSTKHGSPWSLIYDEVFDSRSAAYTREQQIKGYKGGDAFKKLIGL